MRPHLSARTTPLAWCSLLVCSAGVVLALAGCGAAATPAPTRTTAQRPARARQRDLVSAGVIARAARLSEAQPGYAVTLSVSLDSAQLGGVASATATGRFDTDAGSLTAELNLPGVLALISPVTAPVIVADGTAYVEVPQVAADELPGLKPWLSVSLAGAGQLLGLPPAALAGSLTPQTILAALAGDSTGKATVVATTVIGGLPTVEYRESVPKFGAGHAVDVWIDTGSGLLRRIVFDSSSHVEAARIDITAYGAQSIPAAPPASAVGSLSAALAAAGV